MAGSTSRSGSAVIKMSDESEPIKQHCECGSETYHVMTTEARDKIWAQCADCGRPTRVMGDGPEKQQEWYDEQ